MMAGSFDHVTSGVAFTNWGGTITHGASLLALFANRAGDFIQKVT
jgi:hypothetical protein